jgi:hypothetical protein
MQIFVKDSSGTVTIIEVDSSITIAALQAKIKVNKYIMLR